MADWGYDKGFIGSQYIDTRTAQQIEAERREWEGKKAQIKAEHERLLQALGKLDNEKLIKLVDLLGLDVEVY